MDLRKSLIIGLAAILFFSLPVYMREADAASTVKIGALLPFTGAFALNGPRFKNSIDLALDQAGWQVAGKKIELVVEDSATDVGTVRDKLVKLIERDKVAVIIGPLHAGARAANMSYIEANKVPDLAVREDVIEVTKKFRYCFSASGTLQQQTYRMGDYAYDKLGYRTVTVLGSDFIAGHLFGDGFMKRFKERGGAIVQEQWFPLGAVDFAPFLAGLKKADACAVWVAGPGALNLVKQYNEYGIFKKMPMISYYHSGMFDEDVLNEYGDIGLGISGPIDYASTFDTPLNKRYVSEHLKKYGKRPTACGYGAYMSTLITLEALKATGGDTTSERLRDAIAAVKLEGPIGTVRFTPDGVALHTVLIVENAKLNGEYLYKVVGEYPETPPPGQ